MLSKNPEQYSTNWLSFPDWVKFIEQHCLPALLDEQIGALPADPMEWDGATWNAWEQAREALGPTLEEWEMIKND